MKNIWLKFKKLTNNATFATVVGVFAGFIIGMFTKSYQLHDAITYNNISSYIESLMVSPGLINEEILTLNNPFDQLAMIADKMSNQQANYNNILAGLQTYLVSIGEQELTEETYTDDELLDKLEKTSRSIFLIKEENIRLASEQKVLRNQKSAKLSSPKLEILGENIDTTITNYTAIIDGKAYYLEDFLNTFLPETILYENETIMYGQEMTEKLNVVNSELLYDKSNFEIYNGSSHFTMSRNDYSNGVVINSFDKGSISIHCGGNYSTLSLTLGHVDNTSSGNRTLIISYRDTNGKFIEKESIELYGDMPTDTLSIPIYNTETVKLEVTYGGSPAYPSMYGLANIYLIK